MCVIIDKPAGLILAKEDILAAANRNEDGLGVMYRDPSTGEFKVHRQLFDKWKEGATTWEWMEKLKDVHAVFHLRMSTHGGVTLPNAHPFQVLNKKDHGRDLWFMHNGVFHFTPNHATKSDTRMFNEIWLQPVLSKAPDLIFELAFHDMLEGLTGSNNKLLFMDDQGNIIRTGKWETRDGCAVSNNSYFGHYTNTYRGANVSVGKQTGLPPSTVTSSTTKTTTPTLPATTASIKPAWEPVEQLYMVRNICKKEENLELDDLLHLNEDDLEVLVENPEKTHELLCEAIERLKYYDQYFEQQHYG